MYVFIQVLTESVAQALQQLWGNKLRTFLSLLGITIGIWCVIMVFSSVDSLEASIKDSFEELGEDVIYVNTMPWGEDPRENLWKYERRPEPDHSDFKALKSKAESVGLATYTQFLGGTKVDYTYGEVDNVFLMSITDDYKDMFSLEFEQGRYFSPNEFYRGINGVILGYNVATALFKPAENPIGKTVKIKGLPMQVVGILRKEGKDLLNPINFDNAAMITHISAGKFVNAKASAGIKGRGSVSVKAKSGAGMEQLKDEVTGVLRAHRKLKPTEENNFELNTLSILSGIMSEIFAVIRAAGILIGIFAIIVGAFSVANIMFVSVKERTNLIGVKKALGAQNYVILMEFLIESVILCLIGGLLGLGFVYLAAKLATEIFEFNIYLSTANLVWGIGISSITGVISGIIPAYMAAQLDPVEAMRG